MLTRIIETILRFRRMILLLVILATVTSVALLPEAALDAVPDIGEPQIIVYVKWERSPERIETRITTPLVRELQSVPGVRALRATTHLGYSFLYVLLENGADRIRLRRALQDRLNLLRARFPADAQIRLGADAGSTGWIYQYALVDDSGRHDLRELRSLNETRVRPALASVPGIAEVAVVGGLKRQIRIKLYPPLLAEAGIGLRQIETALRGAFEAVGGRSIELNNRDYQVRATGIRASPAELERLVVGHDRQGRAVLLKDIAYLQVDYDLRRGIADLDGKGEVTGGIAIMSQAGNVLTVLEALKERLAQVRETLPAGVRIVTAYDRSRLVWSALKNFAKTLAYELLVTALVMWLALRSRHVMLAPLAVILLGSLFTLAALAIVGQTINLLSLAGLAIAIGEMADASIVIVENTLRKLARREAAGRQQGWHQRRQIILAASSRMLRPLLFSLLIILVSFLPVFFLDAREARLFDPLAWSKTFAMGFSTLLTLFLLPLILLWLFRPGRVIPAASEEGRLAGLYRHSLKSVIRHRYLFVVFGLGLFLHSLWLAASLPREYMPEMDEGALLYMPTTLPGVPVREAAWILQAMDRKLKAFPEVEHVFGKLGRADTASDPAPLSMIEATILLKPRSEWRPGMTRARLQAEMDAALKVTGFVNSWTRPIAGRILMQDSGIQTPVGIKILGPKLHVIESLARQIEEQMRGYPATRSVIAERTAQGYYLDVEPDPPRMAEQGVDMGGFLRSVRYAISGANVLQARGADGEAVALSLQYAPEYANTLEKLRRLPLILPDGEAVSLAAVGRVHIRKRAEMIRNEGGLRAGYVYFDLDDVTPVDYVAGARRYLAQRLRLPEGYRLEWSGTWRYAQQAAKRLAWIVPLTLALILGLLWLTFRAWQPALLVFLSAPFALSGGVILQWWQGYSMTTAVVVGYLAVLAVAIQTGIIMVIFIRDALAAREGSHTDAVIAGSVARLRPKLMTVATTVLSLVPILLASGHGMEISQPIAAPSVGGMLTSTLYVLFLIPCLFVIGEDLRRWRRSLSC